MRRSDLIRLVREELAGRQLVWFGTRGDDVEALAELPELGAVFSVIGAYRKRESVESLAFEDLIERRIDLDVHDIDDELGSEAISGLRRAMLRALSRPSVVVTYRPSTFLSAICFARRDRCTYLGLFKDHQAAFEHKPWVESEVAKLDIAHIPWTYIADEDQLETLRYLDDGPIILRRSRSSGGTGLVRVESGSSLEDEWPRQHEAFVSVAPYIEGGIPLNIGAVVWHDGITLHPASVQLIGLDDFVSRPFGYCGNDFAAVADLDVAALSEVETATLRIGNWLREHGYLGAYGVDFLLSEGVPLFVEVNPRFQGSTHASSQLSVEADMPCILLEHLAAHLEIDSPTSPTLLGLTRQLEPLSHFVVHWTGQKTQRAESIGLVQALLEQPRACRADVVCPPQLPLDEGAAIARVTVRDRVTTDGFHICDPWRKIVAEWRDS